MKTLRIAAVVIFACILSTTAIATARPTTIHAAVDKNIRVHAIKQALHSEGYTLSNTQDQPIYYFVAPKAPYIWGTLIYTYTRTDGDNEETVVFKAIVQNTDKGYAVPEITILETNNNNNSNNNNDPTTNQ